MSNVIKFEKGTYGLRATILTHWKDSYLDQLLKNDVKELVLNTGKGWKGENINFIKLIPDLVSIIILDQTIKSVDPIHNLQKLESINISTYSKSSINFSFFPKLTSCDFDWIKNSESLFDCKNLRSLGINNFDLQSSSLFSNLQNLEKLTILNSKLENLEGVFCLKKLVYLSLANLKKITSINGVEKLHNLEDLEIQRCKSLQSISAAFKLTKLQRLYVLDSTGIESINGIENLSVLKEFLFYESTNILDGDLSPLFKLKNLSKLSFQNRKHYSNRREDF